MKEIYSKLRKKLGCKQKGLVSKLVFPFSDSLKVKQDTIDLQKKFPNGEKGGLIISADLEMSWAWRYTKTGADYIKKGINERDNIKPLLDTFEKYNIPITWATVGHLLLKKCSKGEHDWMARIPHFNDHWRFTKGDWFDHDPYSNYKQSPAWYGGDLIEQIVKQKTKHEIGCHTFSHIDMSYKNCPLKVAQDEIKACIEVGKRLGLKQESFVFPGGMYGNYEVLKNNDFKIYRKKIPDTGLSYPFRDEFGLLVTTTTAMLEYNLKYSWSKEYFVKRLMKIVTKAVKTGTIAHLWFHPSLENELIKSVFPLFFQEVNKLRDSNTLWIGTMKEIANHINKERIV